MSNTESTTEKKWFLKSNKISLVIAILFIASSKLFSADISYLKGMPNPERILNEVKGKDALDTYARQAAALNRVRQVVHIHGMFRMFDPKEEKVITDFHRVSGIAYKNAEKIVGSKRIKESQALVAQYSSDKDFIESILKKYLSPETKIYNETTIAEYDQTMKNKAAIAEKKRNQEEAFGQTLIIGAGVFTLVFWIAIILGAIWLYSRYRKNRIKIKIGQTIYRIKKSKTKELVSQKEIERLMQPQRELWNQLGASKEEREKNIKKMFDSNNKNLSVGISWDFIKGLKAYGGPFLQFRINRNLAAMEPREREFLRIAYSLYNNGQINDRQFEYYNFALVNGDGKAAIEEYRYDWGLDELSRNSYFAIHKPNRNYEHRLPNNCESLKDGPTTVKFYQDQARASVDSAVNNLLKIIEEVGQGNQNIKQVKEIKNRIHGSGAWLSDDETEGTVFNGNGDYPLNLGYLEDNETILHYSGEGSLITIAPPGSGKTQCFVIPNMLNWKGAAVVLDIKGEIHAATHKWREKNIGKVFKFSPLDPKNSNGYNPLVFVRDDVDYIWEDSRFLADMMIVPSGASDPFWENTARDLLTAAIAYVTFNNEANDRAMSKVLDIIYGIGWDEMITSLKTNVMVSSMRRMGNALDEMEKKQRDSVLKTAQSSLSAWQGERIAKVTDKSDWNPLDLRNGTPTIYICINPNEIESYLSVIRVFIAQHIRMLTTELPQRGAAPVLFMLDELPRLKKMPPVDEALNIGRQYGIKLWMFAQSYGQLKDAYSDPEGLIGSCVVRTFMNLPLNDEYTTKISDQLGYRHDALGNTKEKLVEPIELAGPNYKDLILVMATGTKPARVRKKFAYQDKELVERMN